MDKSEITFLSGSHPRWTELKFTINTMLEMIRGFRALHFIGLCTTVFGSARIKENHQYYYQKCRCSICIIGIYNSHE